MNVALYRSSQTGSRFVLNGVLCLIGRSVSMTSSGNGHADTEYAVNTPRNVAFEDIVPELIE